MISKNSIFLKEINRQFKQKSLCKIYLAVVQGYWPDSLNRIDVPLQKYRLESGERMVRVDPGGKRSVTRFRVLERFGRLATLVEAELDTGRTHQIRVHCQHVGHPILGDPKYGGRLRSVETEGGKRLCLHAARLQFHYPADGPLYSVEAGMDLDLLEIVNLLRKQKKVS